MKYIIVIIIIGISEILLFGELQDLIGLKNVLLSYVATTLIAAFILYLNSSKSKNALKYSKYSKNSGRKLRKKTRKPGFVPTQEELKKLQSSLYVSLYIAAVILVVIPGVLTDALGIIIVVPFINNWYINREINKYNKK